MPKLLMPIRAVLRGKASLSPARPSSRAPFSLARPPRSRNAFSHSFLSQCVVFACDLEPFFCFVLFLSSDDSHRFCLFFWFFIFCPGIKVLIIYSSNCSREKEYRVVGSGGK